MYMCNCTLCLMKVKCHTSDQISTEVSFFFYRALGFIAELSYSHMEYIHYTRESIRASVDALCRDGTSEISRDPRTKCLQTRRKSLARPSKHTNNNF